MRLDKHECEGTALRATCASIEQIEHGNGETKIFARESANREVRDDRTTRVFLRFTNYKGKQRNLESRCNKTGHLREITNPIFVGLVFASRNRQLPQCLSLHANKSQCDEEELRKKDEISPDGKS